MAVGEFCWFDIVTSDPDRTARFYRAVMDWELRTWDPVGYRMFGAADGTSVGGMRRLGGSVGTGLGHTHWLGVIQVKDCEAAVARALELGATQASEVATLTGIGHHCVLLDPSGIPFAVFSGNAELPKHPSPLGHVTHVELRGGAEDIEGGFYHQLFGWSSLGEVDLGQRGVRNLFGLAGTSTCVASARLGSPPRWTFTVRVAEVRESLAVVSRFGGQVLMSPRAAMVPGSPGPSRDFLVATCADPDGAEFSVIAPAD